MLFVFEIMFLVVMGLNRNRYDSLPSGVLLPLPTLTRLRTDNWRWNLPMSKCVLPRLKKKRAN